MASGAPDWTRKVVVAVINDTVPVISEPASEAAAGDVGSYTGTDVSYQTVASWTVTAGKIGELKEIVVLSSNYSKTVLRITVGDVTFADGWTKQSAIPLIFEDLKLAAAKTVTVEAKSSDGTSITVDAAIVAKEIG